MPDYSKGKIYKLYNEDEPDKCYIGSTARELSRRYSQHKSDLDCTARILFEDNKTPIIELLEEYPCISKKELEIRERYWIDEYPNRINIQVPSRTQQEKKEYFKQYNSENRDRLKEYRREYRLNKLSTDNST